MAERRSRRAPYTPSCGPWRKPGWYGSGQWSRGGRARTYYELSVPGVREAEAEAVALAEIALAGRRPRRASVAERSAMQERVERVARLFDFTVEARESLSRGRRRA